KTSAYPHPPLKGHPLPGGEGISPAKSLGTEKPPRRATEASMHTIVIASYLTAAVAFLASTGLLTTGWRGQRTGSLLILATTVSMLWGVFLAYAEWHRTVAANWLMVAEVLRYAAWLAFVGALFGA